MLFRFDAWLILQLEKFTHWFQRMTGKDNLFLATICLQFNLMTLIVRSAWVILSQGLGPVMALIYMLPALFASGWVFRMHTHGGLLDRISRIGESASGVANPMKHQPALIIARWLFTLGMIWVWDVIKELVLWYLVGSIGSWSNLLYAATFIFMLFFVSCDPLPPCSSKVMDWLRGWRSTPATENA